jgi:hypothetical protein
VLPFQASDDFVRCEIGSFSPSNFTGTGRKQSPRIFHVAKAKAAADYKGRPPSIDATKVRELKQKSLGASEICEGT